jgi:hypothetical protein
MLLLLTSVSCSSLFHRNPSSIKSEAKENLKVYVMVGFHVDFYHSWRGDAPDDTGYGQDYKVISHSIEILNKANTQNKKAKVYWDFSASHWTLGEFIPKSFPDMIEKWKSRDPKDEFIVGPYNNGINSAATKDEFNKAIELTLSNPSGTGIKQLFKNVGMFYRPQEMFFSSGQTKWLKELGMEGLVLQYATYPFNAFSNFISPLKAEDRFNPIILKSMPNEEGIVVLPSMSPIDLINYVSLEKLMTDLRTKQLSREITRNVVIHLNLDADAISWMPLIDNELITKLVPNIGGINEIVSAVNKYDWADFTTPSEYLKLEKPQKEVLVNQDLADGGFDGMASWAEKQSTQTYWPLIEQSRMIDRFLSFYSHRFNQDTDQFLNRLLTLSSTHFGMSTPFVNYQRLLRLENYTKLTLNDQTKSINDWMINHYNGNGIKFFEYPRYGQEEIVLSNSIQKLETLIPKGSPLAPQKNDYQISPLNSQYDVLTLFRKTNAAEEEISLKSSETNPKCFSNNQLSLKGLDLEINFNEKSGIKNFYYQNYQFGDDSFLSPFISFKEGIDIKNGNNPKYSERIIHPSKYKISSQTCNSSPSINEVKLKTTLNFLGQNNKYSLPIEYNFWTHKDLPYLFLNLNSKIPYTLDEKTPKEAHPQFLRHVDYRFREIALSQLKPFFKNTENITIWKMNYEGQISNYKLNYDQFNAKNINLSSLNNHLTPGWFAITDGEKGILIAFNTNRNDSFGAVPIRFMKKDGVFLNPFGSYFGKQFDYSHVGGEKLGTVLAEMGAQYLRPNAPGFIGEELNYELMIAPFLGVHPNKELINAALTFSYPAMGQLKFNDHFLNLFEMQKEIEKIKKDLGPVPFAPRSLAAAPVDQKIILTWQQLNEGHIDYFELLWKNKFNGDWKTEVIDAKARYFELKNLVNNEKYQLKLRTIFQDQKSDFSNIEETVPSKNYKNNLADGVKINIRILFSFIDMIIKQHQIKNPDLKD